MIGGRHLLTLALALLPVGCDLLLTDPAPAAPQVSVSFALQGTDPEGIARAFSRVNRVLLVFVRPDGAQRDTILRVTESDGRLTTRLVLDSDERVEALRIFAQLRVNTTPLFEGDRTLSVRVGAPTSAELSVTPISAALRGSPRQGVLEVVGDPPVRVHTSLRLRGHDRDRCGTVAFTHTRGGVCNSWRSRGRPSHRTGAVDRAARGVGRYRPGTGAGRRITPEPYPSPPKWNSKRGVYRCTDLY